MTEANQFYIARTEWKRGQATVTWLWPHYATWDEAAKAIKKFIPTDTTTYEIRKKEKNVS
jgi:hypothetical protein